MMESENDGAKEAGFVRKNRRRPAATFAFVVLAIAVVFLSGCAGTGGKTVETLSQEQAQDLEERWGIQVEGLRLTAEGMMVDFRYRVIDSEKAVALLRSAEKPVLVDVATGARFLVPTPPKVGALRNVGRPENGRIYFMLFANPGRYLQPESRVSVEMGDFVAENLVLQ